MRAVDNGAAPADAALRGPVVEAAASKAVMISRASMKYPCRVRWDAFCTCSGGTIMSGSIYEKRSGWFSQYARHSLL
jgi:hypothetical protein